MKVFALSSLATVFSSSVEDLCPSTECWQLNQVSNLCELKDPMPTPCFTVEKNTVLVIRPKFCLKTSKINFYSRFLVPIRIWRSELNILCSELKMARKVILNYFIQKVNIDNLYSTISKWRAINHKGFWDPKTWSQRFVIEFFSLGYIGKSLIFRSQSVHTWDSGFLILW